MARRRRVQYVVLRFGRRRYVVPRKVLGAVLVIVGFRILVSLL